MASAQTSIDLRPFLLALIVSTTPVFAQAGDPQLQTSHPHYPGEGALSSPARCLDHAWRTPRGRLGAATDRERLIRLFLWRCEHFAHELSPSIYALPDRLPDPAAQNGLMYDYDAMRALFSYGFGLCGTNHAQMRVFAEAAGWPSRRRGLVGDTGHELFVDGGWRYVNVDQFTLHALSDDPLAHFASLDQVVEAPHRFLEWNPDYGMGHRLPQANTHGQYASFSGAFGPVPLRSQQWRDYRSNVWNIRSVDSNVTLAEGYTATPIVASLRRGEVFTRTIEPYGVVRDQDLAGPLWWGWNSGQRGAVDSAPVVRFSFVQNAPARDQMMAGPEVSRSNQRYGNACFDWKPALARGELFDGAVERSGVFEVAGAALRARTSASLTLHHYSPYVIAARPLRRNARGDLDPALDAVDGAVLWLQSGGGVSVEVSANAGASWSTPRRLVAGDARYDFTDAVKGRNDYLLRLRFERGATVEALRLRSIGMMSQAVFPSLEAGRTAVRFDQSSTMAMDVSPDLHRADVAQSSTATAVEVERSGNIAGIHFVGEPYAFRSTDNRPIHLTYRVTLPEFLAKSGASIERVHAAFDGSIRAGLAANDGRIELATERHGPWINVARMGDIQSDLSHRWVYGDVAVPMDGRERFWLRFTQHSGGYTTRIRAPKIVLTLRRPAPESAAVDVAWVWREGGRRRTQRHALSTAAGSSPSSRQWTVRTGAAVEQDSVAIAVRSFACPPASVAVLGPGQMMIPAPVLTATPPVVGASSRLSVRDATARGALTHVVVSVGAPTAAVDFAGARLWLDLFTPGNLNVVAAGLTDGQGQFLSTLRVPLRRSMFGAEFRLQARVLDRPGEFGRWSNGLHCVAGCAL